MQVHLHQLRDCHTVVRYWIRTYDTQDFAQASNEYLACIIRFHLVNLDDQLIKRIRKLRDEGRRTCRWTLKPVEAMVLLFCYSVLGVAREHETLQLKMFFGNLHQSNLQEDIWRMSVLANNSLSS